MTLSSDRRRLELAVIDAAREFGQCGTNSLPWLVARNHLQGAVAALDALPLDEPTRARAGGPLLTSQNAAAFVDGARAASVIGRILREIDAKNGMTTEEVCVALGGKHQSISPRIHELWRNGWLRTNGERPTTSGLMASVWQITPEARWALLEGRKAEIEADWLAMSKAVSDGR